MGHLDGVALRQCEYCGAPYDKPGPCVALIPGDKCGRPHGGEGMEAFWKAWAAKAATDQWLIFGDRRAKAVPAVQSVEIDDSRGVFLVTFENGDQLEVVPTGLARPPLASTDPSR